MTYNATVLADSPLAYWPLTDTAGSSTVADLSGHSVTGTVVPGSGTGPVFGVTGGTGGPASVSSWPGWSGGDGYIRFDASTLPRSTTYTLEAWCKITSEPSTQYSIFDYGLDDATDNQHNRLMLIHSGGSPQQFILVNDWEGASGIEAFLPSTFDGAWHYLVVTWAGSTAKMYWDGAKVAQATLTGLSIPAAQNGYIGREKSGNGEFSGLLARLAVYGTALTPARVYAHYTAGVVDSTDGATVAHKYAAAVALDSPSAYWPLTETPAGAGTPYHDAAGGAHNAQLLVGTATAVPGPCSGSTAPHMQTTWAPPGPLANSTSDAIWTASTAGLPVDGQPYTFEVWVKPRVVTAGERADINVTPYATVGANWMSYLAWGPQNYAGPFLGADFLQDTTYHASGTTYITDTATDAANLETWAPNNGVFVPGVTPGVFDGFWHQLAITDTAGGVVTFYLDGVQVDQETGVTGSNGLVYDVANVLFIGDPGYFPTTTWPTLTWPGLAGELYEGALAHVAIYPTALAGSHIAAHFAAAQYYRYTVPGGTLGAAGTALSSPTTALYAPWAFVRGYWLQPQHAPRTLATPEGAAPLRCTPIGDTNVTDAVLAPDDQHVAYYVDWSQTLPAGFGINSVSAQILRRPDAATPWTSATDVTSSFLSSILQLGEQTRVILADGTQTDGQQYRVRILAHFSNIPATVLEAFFDLTCAET